MSDGQFRAFDPAGLLGHDSVVSDILAGGQRLPRDDQVVELNGRAVVEDDLEAAGGELGRAVDCADLQVGHGCCGVPSGIIGGSSGRVAAVNISGSVIASTR